MNAGTTDARTRFEERKLLASILLDNRMLKTFALAVIEPDYFQDTRNMLIFAAMKCLENSGERIGLEALGNLLRDYGQLESVGEGYLCGLTLDVIALPREKEGGSV